MHNKQSQWPSCMTKPPPYSPGLEVSHMSDPGMEVHSNLVELRARECNTNELDAAYNPASNDRQWPQQSSSRVPEVPEPSHQHTDLHQDDQHRSHTRRHELDGGPPSDNHFNQSHRSSVNWNQAPNAESPGDRSSQTIYRSMATIASVIVAAGVGSSIGAYYSGYSSGKSSVDCSPTFPYTPLPPEQVLSLNSSCPSNIRVESSPVELFRCLEHTDLAGFHDITAFLAYTVQSYIEACVTLNLMNGSTRKAVSTSIDMSGAYREYRANCWLRSEFSKEDLVTYEDRTVVYLVIPVWILFSDYGLSI
ncbi:hypothetical protein BU23DRAFT_563596 [Bimuria novae-zelandiae CBS 107.79]|uniref:Uncharacterized protein n=1 Tax=Bimuria novae-zelandiae CBS 107.79 TaxID=1447943 RepID=A0A6A5VNW6_9PLEO|nr:hypothetical protein BU23DRAFT_563596 [Bimuria novae-zelandiae CBS 107.79]